MIKGKIIMHFIEIKENKYEHIELLLLGDEQESMINKYLDKGRMYVLNDDGIKGECVVVKLSDGIYELKNIAVLPDCQRKGYGREFIDFIFNQYPDCEALLAGTGDSQNAASFYLSCGFMESHRVKNFFIDNYDHPIIENGQQLIDMVYYKRNRQ